MNEFADILNLFIANIIAYTFFVAVCSKHLGHLCTVKVKGYAYNQWCCRELWFYHKILQHQRWWILWHFFYSHYWILNSSGTITFTATVTDSRGRTSAAATVSITVIAYSVPSFSSYNSQRCNSSGTIDVDA